MADSPDYTQTVKLYAWDGSNLLPVSVDSNGNLVALMKGTDGTNLQTVKTDTSGQMITILKGASGNDVNVDSDGNITTEIKGTDGATLKTIAVDTDGNIIGVMKGDYSGTLKTIAVDSNGVMKANLAVQDLTYITVDQGKLSTYDVGDSTTLDSSSVASSGNKVVDITPPAGEMWDIRHIFFEAYPVSGATSGYHSVLMQIYAPTTGRLLMDIVEGGSYYNNQLLFDFNTFIYANYYQYPNSIPAQVQQVLAAKATNEYVIRFTYFNWTNATQTVYRLIRVGYRKYKI